MDKFSKGKPGGASKTKNSKFILSSNNNNNKTTTITKPNKTGCPSLEYWLPTLSTKILWKHNCSLVIIPNNTKKNIQKKSTKPADMFKLQRMNIRDQTGRIQAGLLKKYFCLQKKTEKSFIWIGCALNGRFLTTLWLSDYFLMTAWHSLMAAWRLPDNCLMTAWRLPDDWMTTEWQLPDTCLTTAWRLPDDLLMTAWQLPVWWLPDTLVYQRWKYSSLPKFFTFDCQTTALRLRRNIMTKTTK